MFCFVNWFHITIIIRSNFYIKKKIKERIDFIQSITIIFIEHIIFFSVKEGYKVQNSFFGNFHFTIRVKGGSEVNSHTFSLLLEMALFFQPEIWSIRLVQGEEMFLVMPKHF